MHTRKYILTIFTTSLTALLMMVVSLPVCSQEIALQDTLLVNDSLAVDTIVTNDPEWYVAPMTHDLTRAPFRAPAAACPIDSVRTFNVDSVLESVSVYEYGDTTRTMIWTVNPDGSRYGSSRTEEGTNGNITFSATYDWDAVAGNWKGTSKEEHYFAAGKDTAWLVYTWVNNAWVVNTKYTYVRDAFGREIEFTTYQRNASGQLAYSKQRIREYNAAGRTTLDIQYTAHNGTNWSTGTKKVYDYDTAGNQVEYTYYSSYDNGTWVASTHEVSGYTDGNRTYYKKETWNGTEWVFNSESFTAYDEDGNITLQEKYGVKSGVRIGTMKEKYIFDEDQEQICVLSYKWSNGVWEDYSKMLTNYPHGDTIETCQYYWNNETWEGRGTRTFSIYNENGYKAEQVSQKWGKNSAQWENETRVIYFYTDAKKTQEASYKWENDAWVGVARSDWHYTAGKNDTLWVYAFVGTEWVDSLRTVYSYFDNSVSLTHNAAWDRDNAKWVMVSMTRTDILKNEAGRQILSASWSCGADSVWMGVKKDTTAYLDTTSKKTYEAHYTSWVNNDWVASYKIEYQYNENNVQILKDRYNWKNNDWIGYTRVENGYDENGKDTLSATYNKWDAATRSWIGYQKTTKTYNGKGNLTSMMIYKWGTSDWTPSARYTYSYDESNREIEQIVENCKNDIWANANKYEKEYKGSTRVKNNTYQWLSNKWLFTSRNESYYDEDAQAKLRREIIGSWNSNTGALISFADNHYCYACDPKSAFTIRFENENGVLLESQEVKNGAMPVYGGEKPTKENTAQYTYSFKGWDKAIVAATGDATYVAMFDSIVNAYLITFKNGEEVLQSEVLAYGKVPTYDGEKPAKQSNAQYTYAFKGWDAEIVAVTGEATYSAMFDSIVNTYLVTFKNGESILQSEPVAYGTVPTYDGEKPAKQANAQYTYSFKGWDAEIVAVTGEATYSAMFDSIVNTYLVTFKNGESILQSEPVAYGTVPTYNGQTPTKDGNEQHSYVFAGWDAELVAVTGEATYSATFTVTEKTYVITWLNNDGSEIGRDTLKYGATPTPAEATKENTAEFTYTFTGWDKTIVPVAGDATYTAQYDSVRNKYTITFYFDDGKTVVETMVVEYGQMPDPTKTPSKIAEEHYYYTFKGWEPALAPVTGDASYKAVFDVVPQEYLITFKNYNGVVLQKKNVAYGTIPEYTGATPTKPRTQQYSYTFAGWSPELTEVSGAATYTAWYKEVLNQYTIIFVDEDGTELEHQEVEYGKKPVYQGETPVKAEDEQHTYTFAGWTPAIVAVTKNATYRATYTPHDKLQGLWDVQDGAATSTKVIRNGTLYIIRAGKTYTTDGVLIEQ